MSPARGSERGVWGGPARQSPDLPARASQWQAGGSRHLAGGPAAELRRGGAAFAFVVSQPRLGAFPVHAPEAVLGAWRTFATTLDDFGMTPAFSSRGELLSYKAVRGDTFSKIAAKFGISIETVVKANPDVKPNKLTLGIVLQVPPVSGIVYTAKDGDTLESIADAFRVASDDIASANRSSNMALVGAGTRLIIPGASGARALAQGKPLPSLKGYFVMPASGFNLGKLHPVNAVDIAGVCGTPVVAAAEGLVVPDEQYGEGKDGWNGGYGRFVLIEHPAGANVRTRYAHVRTISAGVGDYVKQGQQIGTIGDTGDASGCHVHFEVLGAANPFAK